MLWQAITLRLFSGQITRSRYWVGVRLGMFAGGLLVMGYLAYRYTPQLGISYTLPQVLALIYAGSMVTVLAIGMLTDAYQNAFLSRLRILTSLPLSASTVRRAYGYASLPIALVAMALFVPAVASALRGSTSVVMLAAIGFAYCSGAVLFDILLRLTQMPAIGRWSIRILGMALSMLFVRQLILPGVHTVACCTAAGFALAVVLCTAKFMQAPVRTDFTPRHIPVIEGRPTLLNQLALRASRTGRYIGASAVLSVALGAVLLLSIHAIPQFPVDGAFFMALLLIGTIGQEVRALSRRRYPVELTLYGLPAEWLMGAWLLSVVQALLCIDVCLAAVIAWAPHSLSVSYLQAGYMGLGFVAVGIASASIVVPQRYDLLAQCAATALYGVGAWGVIRLFSMNVYGLSYAVLGIGLLMVAVSVAYVCERTRWFITIRR